MKKLSTIVGAIAIACLGTVGATSTAQAAPQEYQTCVDAEGNPSNGFYAIANKPCTITYAVDACGSTNKPYTRTLLYMKNGAVREVKTETSAPNNCN